MMPLRFLLNRTRRFLIYRVLHVDDTPHRIALGLAVGIFMTWTPLIGLQMILTVLLSALLRANKFVGVPFVWISNPLTAVPLYGFNFVVGAWILPGEYSTKHFVQQVGQAAMTGGGIPDRVYAWWTATLDFFWPLWVGSILLGLIFSVVTYFVTRRAVVLYRAHRHRHDAPGQGPQASSPAETKPSSPAVKAADKISA